MMMTIIMMTIMMMTMMCEPVEQSFLLHLEAALPLSVLRQELHIAQTNSPCKKYFLLFSRDFTKPTHLQARKELAPKKRQIQ